jgi:hypothetical protein
MLSMLPKLALVEMPMSAASSAGASSMPSPR